MLKGIPDYAPLSPRLRQRTCRPTTSNARFNAVLENFPARPTRRFCLKATAPAAFESVLNAVKAARLDTSVAEISMIPQNYIKLEGHAANTMIRLLEALEDHDDVQHVYSNFDVDTKQLEEVAG